MRQMAMTPEQEQLFKVLAGYRVYRFDDQLKIYKYVPADTAKLIFKDHSLKFSTPADLKANDCEIELLKVNLTLKQLREEKIKDITRSLVEHKNYSISQARQFLKSKGGQKILASIPTEIYGNIILQAMKSLHTNTRFFCATTSFNNARMWEEYADLHRGVCIEYKFYTFFTTYFFGFRVFYDETFSPFNLFDNKGRKDPIALYRWYFTKRHRYSFEDEVRLMTNIDEDIWVFPKEIFTGVYYGKNTSQNDIDEIEQLLQNGYSFTKGERINSSGLLALENM